MKFRAGSKSKSKVPAGQASPASSTSSFISVGRLMEQRERPERATVDQIDDKDTLDEALDAMSLEETTLDTAHSPDELFDAYTGYMEVIKASVSKKASRAALRNGPKVAASAHTAKPKQKSALNPYICSMQDVVDRKGRAGGHAAKATGETRRLMEEIEVAKENMHLFNRLVAVLPSTDLERRALLKAFGKSRQYLEKMSRFASERGSAAAARPSRAAWDEYWVGCMV